MNKFTRWRRRLGARFAPRAEALFLAGDAAPFVDWCEAHAGEAAEIIVSARALHELVCEPGLPLKDEAALQDYARQLFGHYFGAAAQRWPLAGWRAAEQRGASALHGLDWAAIQQAAEAHDVDLRRVRPVWAPVLAHLAAEEPEWLRADTAGLAWVEGSLLSWLSLRGGVLSGLRQLRLAEPTTAALGDALAELRAGVQSVLVMGYGLDGGVVSWPGVRVLGRLDGGEPKAALFEAHAAPAGLPQPDFLGLRLRRSPLAWPLALTGALVLATAGWGAWDSRAQRDEAEQQLARMARTGRPVAAAPRAAAPRLVESASAKAAEAERLRGAREVQGLLQQGWEPLLSNVEQAGAGRLAWLGLDYNASRNELRLEGLVQDKLAALQLADRLAAQPGWGDVVLSRFQTGEQGLAGQRFELGARLQPERLTAQLEKQTMEKKTP